MERRFFFVPDHRKERIALHDVLRKGGGSNDIIGTVAKYFCSEIVSMSGVPIPNCNGMIGFGLWLRFEFNENGIMRAGMLDKYGNVKGNGLPFPDEIWAIYRTMMLAKYNLKSLPKTMNLIFKTA